MEADLVDVKQLFSNMMRGVQPWILSHFIMWLDLKVAEYKVLGYMVLDKKSVYEKDLQASSSKTSTPSPALSEHMYVVSESSNGPLPTPTLTKENKEYDNFAELVQHNKRKNITLSGITTSDNTLKGVDKDSVSKDQDVGDIRVLENGSHNQRKQRKPGKVLHSIVNNLKQNCNKTGNQSTISFDSDKSRQSPKHGLDGDEKMDKVPNHIEQINLNQKERIVSMTTAKAYSRPPHPPPVLSQDMSEVDEDNTPLYKSQQFSSLISLSRSRGRRRRSSNDEITYPLITMKDAEIPQTEYNDEPKSQNLADFYFAQNQLDEQFAVRRAKQSICRSSNKSLNDKDVSESDKVHHPADAENQKEDGIMANTRFPTIKQERLESDYNEHQRNLNKSPGKPSNFEQENSNHSNISQNTGDKIFIKSEPQNDQDYFVSSSGSQYERLSNQSFSSEGDSYHDNSTQFEYHGDDIADESYVFNNSELYGDDYIGSTQGMPGADNHDNKMMRPKSFKKRPITCSPNLVPRDPTSGKFVCELCGGTFTNRSSYFRHKRIHGEKKFRCFLCDKAFHRKEHLQSHIHRHTKSFPLKCGQCSYQSHSLDEATTHFQTVHNQDSKESP